MPRRSARTRRQTQAQFIQLQVVDGQVVGIGGAEGEELRHDGTFQHINLIAPDRVDRITIHSGYYAPKP